MHSLWCQPAYTMRRYEAAVQRIQVLQLGEGKVVDLGRGENALFLDFAADHRGFRLRLSPDALALFRSEAIDPSAFVGRRIRARGFIHGSERPTIDVTYPEQIERLTRGAKKSPGARAGARRWRARSIYG